MSKGRSARRKGHQFERDIANEFRSVFPDARRAVEDPVVGEGIDITNTGPIAIQCKRFKGPIPMSHLEEVKQRSGRIPLLVSKSDRCRTKVTMYLEDFIKILQEGVNK